MFGNLSRGKHNVKYLSIFIFFFSNYCKKGCENDPGRALALRALTLKNVISVAPSH